MEVDLIDIRTAHLNARPTTPTYVELPPGRAEEGKCGRLEWGLYGARVRH